MLERELAATRESLQAAIEELEAKNEELQAANEELQSSNEELQSVNEELNTVNAEIQEKIGVLNPFNADLEGIAKAASAAKVFVDQELRLTRFSPDAGQIFGVCDTDIGRRVDDISHTLDYPELIADLNRVLAGGQMVEREVRGEGGKTFLAQMFPYNVSPSNRRGAVVSFVDVTSFHVRDVLDALAEHIAVLDSEGTIMMANAAWRRFAERSGDDRMRRSGPGSNYFDACRSASGSEDPIVTQAMEGVRAVLEGRLPRFTLEYPCHSPGQQRWFVMHTTPIPHHTGGAVVSRLDVTAWKVRDGRGGEAEICNLSTSGESPPHDHG